MHDILPLKRICSESRNLFKFWELSGNILITVHFASAAVAVDSSHMTASSSASWSRFSPPSNFVNGHVSTMWFMVCRWPQSQEVIELGPNCASLHDMDLDPFRNGLAETMYDEGDQNRAVG